MWSFYYRIRCLKGLSMLVVLIRYVIGFAFIPSGYKKLVGIRFTQLAINTPIGLLFEGLYQTGWYWRFLGLCQLVTALLLMTQRFATLGNLIFLTIAVNIWVITVTMGFAGTWVITSMLVFASLSLLLWDTNKLYLLVAADNPFYRLADVILPTYTAHWALGGLVLFIESVSLSVLGMSQTYADGMPFMLALIGFTGVCLLVIDLVLKTRQTKFTR